MSISRAPFFTATAVSAALLSEGIAPRGNPTTQQGVTSVPASSAAASAMRLGFTHTDAKPYCFASSQSFFTCAAVASGFRMVWSIYFASVLPSMFKHSFFIVCRAWSSI